MRRMMMVNSSSGHRAWMVSCILVKGTVNIRIRPPYSETLASSSFTFSSARSLV